MWWSHTGSMHLDVVWFSQKLSTKVVFVKDQATEDTQYTIH